MKVRCIRRRRRGRDTTGQGRTTSPERSNGSGNDSARKRKGAVKKETGILATGIESGRESGLWSGIESGLWSGSGTVTGTTDTVGPGAETVIITNQNRGSDESFHHLGKDGSSLRPERGEIGIGRGPATGEIHVKYETDRSENAPGQGHENAKGQGQRNERGHDQKREDRSDHRRNTRNAKRSTSTNTSTSQSPATKNCTGQKEIGKKHVTDVINVSALDVVDVECKRKGPKLEFDC